MDTRTGKIYHFQDDEEKEAVEKQLGRKLAPLTEKQAKKLKPLSKRYRKKLLAGMSCPCASGKSFKKCCWKKYR
jgi:uncharacterized protein YecA (UPF0149 family)